MYDDDDDRENRIFQIEVAALNLARTIADAAAALLDLHGEDGYLEEWVQHPFPVDALDALNAEIARQADGSPDPFAHY